MFKIGDVFIYFVLGLFLMFIGSAGMTMKNEVGSKVEIYVNNKLYQVEELKKEKKQFNIPTDLGGIDVLIENEKIKVLTSNSPKKIIVKQGYIWKVGETLIGIPDKVLIKVVGESDLDYVIK